MLKVDCSHSSCIVFQNNMSSSIVDLTNPHVKNIVLHRAHLCWETSIEKPRGTPVYHQTRVPESDDKKEITERVNCLSINRVTVTAHQWSYSHRSPRVRAWITSTHTVGAHTITTWLESASESKVKLLSFGNLNSSYDCTTFWRIMIYCRS